jgi:nucleotide-binding universal stress UspA family protein
MQNIHRILIAIDNEPTADAVASAALQLVEQLHTKVALISVVQLPAMVSSSYDGMGLGMNMTDNVEAEIAIEDSWQTDYEHIHKRILENVFFNHQVETFIVRGVPSDEILIAAEKWRADLIIVGTHGRVGLDHLLIGSIAEKVIRHSTLPVFVVPTKK